MYIGHHKKRIYKQNGTHYIGRPFSIHTHLLYAHTYINSSGCKTRYPCCFVSVRIQSCKVVVNYRVYQLLFIFDYLPTSFNCHPNLSQLVRAFISQLVNGSNSYLVRVCVLPSDWGWTASVDLHYKGSSQILIGFAGLN